MDYRVIRSARPEEPLRQRILALAETAEQRGRPFLLGLSGGSTPRELYRELAEPLSCLRQLYLVQVDERMVPDQHPESNWSMISSLLAGPAGVPPERILRVDPGASAAVYARRLQLLLEGVGRVGLDVAVLGLGADGHTASVFPEDERFERPDPAYLSSSPAHPHQRVTLSLPFLSNSGLLLMLVKGEEKRRALDGVLSGERGLPAAQLPREKTEIYTDLPEG
jgi:6-phosphogluconolactonase